MLRSLLIILGYLIYRLDFRDPEQLTIAEPPLSPEEALRRCYRSALGAQLSFSNDKEN